MEAATAHVPPQNLEAEESVLGALMVSEAAMNPVILDVRLEREDFYRERHRIIFRAIKRLYERSEPIDALTVSELLAQQGELERGRRPRGGLQPRLVGARRRQRPPLRADRPAELAAAPAARRLAADPEVGPRARGRAAGARRARRAAALQRRPRGAGRGLPRPQGHPLARGRPARGARQRRRRGHRHAVGLRRPRQDHRRLPARQPDHPRRPARAWASRASSPTSPSTSPSRSAARSPSSRSRCRTPSSPSG